MRASPAEMTALLPSRLANTGESGDITPVANAKGRARTPAESGL